MSHVTVRENLAQISAATVWHRHEAPAAWSLTRAVRDGQVLRLRRDHYALPGVIPEIAEAVRIGGRLACVTLLHLIGVFVLDAPGVHVHLPAHASRIRPRRSASTVLHWSDACDGSGPRHVVDIGVAVLQAVRCQSPRAALATLDSVLHHGLMNLDELRMLFSELPARFGKLLALVDGSAESGPETFMRLLLRSIGVSFETQVWLPGVGRVDFLVDGWLIIECDSKEFHEGWDKQREDRRRDLAAARLGFVTIRPLATDILRDSARVRTDLVQILAAFPHRGASLAPAPRP